MKLMSKEIILVTAENSYFWQKNSISNAHIIDVKQW